MKCKNCNKDIKSDKGMILHLKSCNALETVKVIETIPEAKEELIDTSMLQRKIDKLLDLRKSTFDAETRFRIDEEIKELRGV